MSRGLNVSSLKINECSVPQREHFSNFTCSFLLLLRGKGMKDGRREGAFSCKKEKQLFGCSEKFDGIS